MPIKNFGTYTMTIDMLSSFDATHVKGNVASESLIADVGKAIRALADTAITADGAVLPSRTYHHDEHCSTVSEDADGQTNAEFNAQTDAEAAAEVSV